jgi:hypothetical protein
VVLVGFSALVVDWERRRVSLPALELPRLAGEMQGELLQDLEQARREREKQTRATSPLELPRKEYLAEYRAELHSHYRWKAGVSGELALPGLLTAREPPDREQHHNWDRNAPVDLPTEGTDNFYNSYIYYFPASGSVEP